MKKKLLSLFLILCLALCLLPGAALAMEDFSGYTKVTTFEELKTAAANASVTGILVAAPSEEGRILVTEDVNLTGKKLCVKSTNLRVMENATLTLGSLDDLYFADAGGNIRVLEGGGTIVIGGTKLVSASDETAVFLVKTNGILVNGLVSLPDDAYPVNAGEDGSIFIVGDADSHGGTVPSSLTVVMDAFGDGNTLNVLGDLTVGHFDDGDQNVTVAEGVRFTILDRMEAPTTESNVQRLIVNDVDVLASENKADVLGNGTVSFDPQTGVLTLNNANLTKGCSEQAEEWAEHPAVLFHGDLTIHLKGSNTIVSGTTSVMGQKLRDNSIVGDSLTVMADPGASLTANGLFQLESYTQKNGTVTIALENDHKTITKWAMYIHNAFNIEGGTLSASTTGSNKNGAVVLDGDNFNIAANAELYEGSGSFGNRVSTLTISRGLTYTTANYVKIVLPDVPQTSDSPTVTRQNIPATGTAYASTQTVELDGKTITLPAYALKDANGNPTNYVRLRDLASLLNGTAAQFDVVWSAESGIRLVARHAYDHTNGSESGVPFTGDQAYTAYLKDTNVDDQAMPLTAFQVQGGGYTYYQLRDLGKALGFNVGWSAGRGIFIETDKAYTDAD